MHSMFIKMEWYLPKAAALAFALNITMAAGAATGRDSGGASDDKPASAPVSEGAKQNPQPAKGASQSKSDSAKESPWLDISVEQRTRYEMLDNRFRAGEKGSDQQLPQRTRVRFEIKKLAGPFGFVMEFEDARTHLNDSGSTVTNNIVDENDFTRFYLTAALNHSRSLPSMLYVGRQSFDLGNRRLFARNRFRNATNAFDGIRWTLGNERHWLLNAFLVKPVKRRMKQPDVPDHNTTFWGAYLAGKFSSHFKNEVYYFGIHENMTSPQSQKRRFSTIGTRLYKDPKPGALSYELEGALQFGKRGTLDHLAHFEHILADYTFNTRWRPVFTSRYDYGSGTKDPTSQNEGMFDTLFGARRWEWGPTGIYGGWTRSNISSPGWALELNPTKKLRFSPAMRWFWLASARDQWVGSGLKDPTGKSGSYLGHQLELPFQYSFKRLIIETGYLRFIKGSYQERVPKSPTAQDSNYFWVSTNFILDHLLALGKSR
jgi:hypothetical protein